MGQSYQSAAIEGTTKAFHLEDKRSLFYKYENKSKLKQTLHFISSLRVKCMNLELAKLEKTRKDAKTSAQVGFEETFYRVTTIIASFTTIRCQ